MSGTLARSAEFTDRGVLFVHGAGTPAEVAFDVPVDGYSWMAHLAQAGFGSFSMDVTGYGRSTRPHVMSDPCNLSPEQRLAVLGHDCEPSYEFAVDNIASDWADIDAVVDYIRELRGVDRVSLVGWSLGGPRAGGYAARHPDKVDRLVLLAPAYNGEMPASAPSGRPERRAAITKQSRGDFIANWDRQVGCREQYDPAVAAVIFDEMLASDPVGATWPQAVRRAPNTTVWGWNADVVRRMQTPMLIVQGIHDGQVAPERARALYSDLGAANKIFLDLGCASHNAMWEKDADALFDASYQWISGGRYRGQTRGRFELP